MAQLITKLMVLICNIFTLDLFRSASHCRAGAMMFAEDNITIDTVLGDGSDSRFGVIGVS